MPLDLQLWGIYRDFIAVCYLHHVQEGCANPYQFQWWGVRAQKSYGKARKNPKPLETLPNT